MWCNDIWVCDATNLSAKKNIFTTVTVADEWCLRGQRKNVKKHTNSKFCKYNFLSIHSFICSHFRQQWQKKTSKAEGWVMMILTQAGKTQAPRRWCLPSSHEPWWCPSVARSRHLLPSPQTHRDGWAFRSPGGPRGRWSHVVRCWSPGSGCNMWAQHLTQSRSLLPTL